MGRTTKMLWFELHLKNTALGLSFAAMASNHGVYSDLLHPEATRGAVFTRRT